MEKEGYTRWRCRWNDIKNKSREGKLYIYKKDIHKYKDQVKLSKLRELKQASSNLIFINIIFEFRHVRSNAYFTFITYDHFYYRTILTEKNEKLHTWKW